MFPVLEGPWAAPSDLRTGAESGIEIGKGPGCAGLVERREGVRVRRGGCVGQEAAVDGAISKHILCVEAVDAVRASRGGSCGALGVGGDTAARQYGRQQRKDS